MEVAMRPAQPADFLAATWNVFHGSPVERLRPVLRQLRADGVTLLLMQEVSSPDVRVMLHEEGLEVAFAPRQYVVAYDPKAWEREGSVELVRLGATRWFSVTGAPQWSEAVRVILRHRPSGLTVDALSYHTPAGVQRGGPAIDSVPRRIAVLRESMATLTRLANEDRADAVLYGGDDNVDERHGTGWDFMLEAATGLRQVAAPEGTHGRRRIDDFRTRGLTPLAGHGVENVSDHDIHVRAFRFADRKEPAVATDPYAITTHDGKRVDEITHQALLAAEKILGYELTITQGSYNTGKVSASAGTHDGGGVVDLARFDADRKVRVLRSIGFAAWRRRAIPGLWPEHVHAVLIGNRRLSDSAARQVQAYLAGRNGLANNGPDDGPREFVSHRFVWPPPTPALTRVQRARLLLARALRLLDQPPKER
jgi:hypothetical protein